LNEELWNIYLDVQTMCALFYDNEKTHAVNLGMFSEIVMSLSYRLLSFRAVNDNEDLSADDAVYHMGLVIFMMTTFLECGPRKLVHFVAALESIKNVLNRYLDACDDKTVFWMMIIAGICTSGDVDDDWLNVKLRAMAAKLGVKSWNEARETIALLPWIGTLHDKRSQKLWDRAFGGLELINVS
jgi:hypothetical protein